jgi:hypothetical protein
MRGTVAGHNNREKSQRLDSFCKVSQKAVAIGEDDLFLDWFLQFLALFRPKKIILLDPSVSSRVYTCKNSFSCPKHHSPTYRSEVGDSRQMAPSTWIPKK